MADTIKWNGLKRTPLRKVSKKQAEKNKLWLKIKGERIAYLVEKYDYCPCEYCKAVVGKLGRAAHHIIRRWRSGTDTPGNCYICHRQCHDYIHLKGIKVKQEDFQGYKGGE